MKFKNPIIRGFNPDPSICRVGDEYYLVTSTFEYFPGIPVYHSKDLVNWTQIGNCISRPEQLPLDTARSSGGIWAPTIRYNNGRFYVTATYSGLGNFIVSTDDPKGAWSDPVMTEFSGIDPSMIFDDGKLYYCATDFGERQDKYGSEGISLAEMDPDTGKVIGDIKRIWCGMGGGWTEAPHIYHIGRYYYIIAAEGGTGNGHHEVAAAASNIWGPYEAVEKEPILTNRNDCTKGITCTGHADLVDDTNGNWWAVHLGVRPIEGMAVLGRETFLMPVFLGDKDIRIGDAGMARLTVDAAISGKQQIISRLVPKSSSSGADIRWLFKRIPDKDSYRYTDSEIILIPSRTRISDKQGSPTCMLLRSLDIECEFNVEIDFKTVKNGDSAGAAAYLNEDFYYALYKSREDDEDHIVFERRVGDMVTEHRMKISSDTLRLRIISDGMRYSFFYAEENGEYIMAGSGCMKLLSTNIAGKCFTGVLMGVFAQCREKTDAQAYVRHVEMAARGCSKMHRPHKANEIK